ncbi:HNH endonuclease signature motif containing protein [Brevibacterium sp. H602]|uniref:HNH endonuclease signature motif containing protein n=1 Tax=Brevibacterium sp. H602 TaxID=3444316 RepID=UPI003EBBE5C8
MKNIGDSDGRVFGLPAAPPAEADGRTLSQFRRAHGLRVEVAEDYELVDLLDAYTRSSLAQVNSLIATSHVVAQDVAYALGLKDGQLDAVYEFASFTETSTRYSSPESRSTIAARHERKAQTEAADSSPVTRQGISDEAIDQKICAVDIPSEDLFSTRRTWTNRENLAWAQAAAQVEAESGTKIGVSAGPKKDRAAGRRLRRVRKLAEELLSDPALLPDFPGFDPELTFFTWLRGSIEPTEAGVYSSLLGTTTSKSLQHMTSSMTLAHGLPRFLKRCLAGDFTIEHVDCVTRACRDLHFKHLPAMDDYLAHRRADITIETFKRSLALHIAVLQPSEDTLKSVSLRRRVDFCTGDDGTAYLTLTGPAPELQACFRRLDAFARAVHKNNTSAFSNQLKAGDCFDEERSVSALMFDILTRTRPQLKLRIISTNEADGSSTSSDFSLDGLFAGPDGVPMHEGESLLDYIERVFDDMDTNGDEGPTGSRIAETDGSSRQTPVSHGDSDRAARPLHDDPFYQAPARTTPADRVFESQLLEAILSSNNTTDRVKADGLSALVGSRASGGRPTAEGTAAATANSVDAFDNPILDTGERRISFEFLLDMPTSEYWLANQASTFITVPMLTLLSQFQPDGNGSPPPTVDPSGSPLPTVDPPDQQSSPTTPPIPEPTDPISPLTDPPSDSASTSPDAPLTSEEVCDLAGMLPDGSPIPADMARRVAGYSTTWTRLLTDPATGTPLDAKATSYAIPNSVRKTLVAQFVTCTFPGCTQPAEVTEVDHIDPFNHSDPTQGGLTRFGNLHCLCKAHHLQKTNGNFDVRMTEPGHLEYVFRQGVTAEVISPDNPISVEHARLFLERFGSGLSRQVRAVTPERSSTEDLLAHEYVPAPERDSDIEREPDVDRGSDAEPPSAHAEPSGAHGGRADADHPVPGGRKQARECPEPAATPGTPGWRELVAGDLYTFTLKPATCTPDQASGAGQADEDNSELRDWFWDSGEAPPF